MNENEDRHVSLKVRDSMNGNSTHTDQVIFAYLRIKDGWRKWRRIFIISHETKIKAIYLKGNAKKITFFNKQ